MRPLLSGSLFTLTTMLLLGPKPAAACEAARLKFDGTPFAQNEIQLEKQEIYFFRGQHNQTMFAHGQAVGEWCYVSLRSAPQEPIRGCLSQGLKRVLIIRDSKRAQVATLRVQGASLVASLLDTDGKPSGKRIQFTRALEKGESVLEVQGWNCPNSRFLSCVGADIRTLPNYVPASELTVAEPVDLAQHLGHYRISCNGVHESHLDRASK